MPLSSKLYHLHFLGSGLPLYFYFIKLCFLTLTSFIMLFFIQIILSYFLVDQKCHNDGNKKHCKSSFIYHIAFLSIHNDPTFHVIEETIFVFGNLLFIFTLQLVRYKLLKTQKIIDIGINTPSDYTILITNMPDIHQNKREIKHFIMSKWNEVYNEKPLTIKKIVLTNNITNFVNLMKDQDNLLNYRKKLIYFHRLYGFYPQNLDLFLIEKKIKVNNLKIEQIKNEINQNFLQKINSLYFYNFFYT